MIGEKLNVKNLLMAILLLMAGSGCFVIKSSDTECRESTVTDKLIGPASEDSEAYHWEQNKYDVETGKRISIGFFPGFGEYFFEDKGEKIDHGGGIDKWEVSDGDNGQGALIGYLVCGTIFTPVSLLWAPFAEVPGGWSALGLAGCHRWHIVHRKETLVAQELTEDGIRKRDGFGKGIQCPLLGKLVIGKSGDGTELYCTYPGFDKLYAAVEAKGKADVMFQHGDPLAEQFAYRRFRLSKNVKAALTFEDIGNGVDAIADKEIKYRREISQIKLEIEALTEHPGYKCCSEELRKAVNELTNRVGLALNQLSSEAGNTAEKLKLDATSINERLEKACQDERVRLQKKAEEERAAARKRADERQQMLIALKKSFEEDVKKADEGDVEAQFRVGNAYRVGNDVVSKNRKLARKYLRKAYDGGCEKAWDALEALQTP